MGVSVINEKILFLTSIVQIKWYEDVYQKKSWGVFFTIVIQGRLVDILALQGRRQMYFNVIFTVQLYLEMHMSLLQLVILAKEVETYQGRTRC